MFSTRRCCCRLPLRGRAGSARNSVLGILAGLAVIGGLGWFVWGRGGPKIEHDLVLTTVVRGPFDHVVLEQGEVESSSNIEIKCEVESRNTSGTAIIDVIPEGTIVQKGDWLVTLDSSALEDEKQRQKIAVNTSNAGMIAAKSALEQAKIAREEYLEGTYKQEEKTIQSEILLAEEKLSRARETAKFSQRLAALGFQTALQLKADLFAVRSSEVDLDMAKGRLTTLQQITQRKMLIGFDSDIEAADAKYRAEQDSYQEELDKLRDIEAQIAKCDIRAPAAGQVVYANEYNRRGGGAEFVVIAGALVRERQTIVRLPDPSQMQVKATINESRITLVREGMPVDIRIGAFDERRELRGKVKRVNKYAEPGSWFSSQVKEYAAFIEIDDPPPDIRSGMTAEVRVHVDQQPSALQVPVQAVYEHKGRIFCLVQSGDDFETREIEMGATNDKTLTVLSGLDESEQVVLNPREFPDLLQLPALPDPEELRALAARTAQRAARPAAADGAGPAIEAPAQPGDTVAKKSETTLADERAKGDAHQESHAERTEASE